MANPTLNARGIRLLVALCRYVELHGNATWQARHAAKLLRAASGDTTEPERGKVASELGKALATIQAEIESQRGTDG